MLPVTCCYWRQEYTVKPHFTVTSLLRTVFLVPSPYISSKFNSLNRDTFYCPLRVRIKWVWLYMDWNFSSFNAMYAKTTKKLWQMLPNGIFLIALSSSYQYTSILCITWWQNPFKLETRYQPVFFVQPVFWSPLEGYQALNMDQVTQQLHSRQPVGIKLTTFQIYVTTENHKAFWKNGPLREHVLTVNQ